ncbi:MAG: hypothetical protein ACYS91_19720 [Planctomycetota bacterium]|jgi:hypothetical protein
MSWEHLPSNPRVSKNPGASNPASGLTLETIVGHHNVNEVKIIAAGRPKALLAITIEGNKVPPDIHEKLVAWTEHTL